MRTPNFLRFLIHSPLHFSQYKHGSGAGHDRTSRSSGKEPVSGETVVKAASVDDRDPVCVERCANDSPLQHFMVFRLW
jgi:hypothetical protein